MKDLLRISDLTSRDVHLLLDLSEAVRRSPMANRGLLTGDTVVTYFAKPSTRTRLSFASAITRLGGTIEDTARVISRYARASRSRPRRGMSQNRRSSLVPNSWRQRRARRCS